MKTILGIIIGIVGIVAGLYLGGYVMFWGGITGIINNIDPLQTKELAISILKLIFCEIGFLPAWLGFVVGTAMIVTD